ncbi:PREDICTED: cuticle collagen 1-like [Chinchilla lanigera]|uniref:cuticle collagen 1-like n=1 Tax=Chinchilla lanigera TaxID=34839 RepID=UPI00038EAA06|nr:PREDICTED: cuticle collagen 1-like [Chinchilla lanigera]
MLRAAVRGFLRSPLAPALRPLRRSGGTEPEGFPLKRAPEFGVHGLCEYTPSPPLPVLCGEERPPGRPAGWDAGAASPVPRGRPCPAGRPGGGGAAGGGPSLAWRAACSPRFPAALAPPRSALGGRDSKRGFAPFQPGAFTLNPETQSASGTWPPWPVAEVP